MLWELAQHNHMIHKMKHAASYVYQIEFTKTLSISESASMI